MEKEHQKNHLTSIAKIAIRSAERNHALRFPYLDSLVHVGKRLLSVICRPHKPHGSKYSLLLPQSGDRLKGQGSKNTAHIPLLLKGFVTPLCENVVEKPRACDRIKKMPAGTIRVPMRIHSFISSNQCLFYFSSNITPDQAFDEREGEIHGGSRAA